MKTAAWACGMGKAKEVPEAIRKANEDGKKHLINVPTERHHHPASQSWAYYRHREGCRSFPLRKALA